MQLQQNRHSDSVSSRTIKGIALSVATVVAGGWLVGNCAADVLGNREGSCPLPVQFGAEQVDRYVRANRPDTQEAFERIGSQVQASIRVYEDVCPVSAMNSITETANTRLIRAARQQGLTIGTPRHLESVQRVLGN